MTTPRGTTAFMAILCGVTFVVVNVFFFFLSTSYFESHHEIIGSASVATFSPDQMTHIRIVFGGITAIVAAVGFVAGLAPRAVGHVLPALIGVFCFVGGCAALLSSLPGVVGVTLLITGGLLPVLAHFSFRHSRPAWSFLISICGVLAVVGLFGAPKLRGIFDVSLWTTMILPGLNAVAVATLLALRDDYVER
jgi:hypothetical protein